MSDLEDGEIIESDNEEIPPHKLELKEQASAPTANHSVWNQPRPQAQTHFRPIKCPGLSDSDDSPSNSDDDAPPLSSKYSKNYPAPTNRDVEFINPLRQATFTASSTQSIERSAPAKSSASSIVNPRKRRNLGVWGNVLQEQTLEKTISGVGMEEKPESDRDVESYNYMRAYDDPRQAQHITYEDDINEEELKSDNGSSEGEPTEALVAKEAFGFIVDRDNRKRKRVKARLGKRSNSDKTSVKDRLGQVEDSGDRMNIQDSKSGDPADDNGDHSDGEMVTSRPSAVDRLGERSFSDGKDRSHIRASPDDTVEKIVKELLFTLDEPKHMQPLFERVVETAGGRKALEILYMTDDLEEAGGLFTIDGSRRRTAGGVFLFLVKTDKELTKEQKDIIFGPVNEYRKKKKRGRRKVMRQIEAKMVEEAAALQERSGLTPSPVEDMKEDVQIACESVGINSDGMKITDSLDKAAIMESDGELDFSLGEADCNVQIESI